MGGFFGIDPCQLFPCIEGFIGRIPEGTAYAYGIVVAQVSADLAQYHGNRIGREFNILGDVKIINGFNQADAANLKQVIYVLLAV